jgi:predicted ATPase/DNA-binding winged helix-turn-helix (wHTH) protein
MSPATRQLLVDNEPVLLGARAFDVLLALIEHRDRLVTKNELLDLVWPGLVVEENNLQVQISTLRKVLGPQAIATIPGRGYRFTAVLEGPPSTNAAAEPREKSDSYPSLSVPMTNVSIGLHSLVGREEDLAVLHRLLANHRLVSVVGAGGIGKTRVAQAAAYAQLGRPGDGVWLVELAPITDPLQIITAVAAAAAVSVDRAQDPRSALLRALRPLDMLLVLDNCEHVLGDVSSLVREALIAAPNVRWLTSSIEPLKLADEYVCRLGALAIPPPGTPLDQAMGFGALALFALRVHAADRHFALADENVAIAIDICRLLDGVPLALEMAAARLPLLGLAGVRDKLENRLHVLRAARGVPSRQQTLRATLDWSYALLSPDEKKLLRRIAVFVNGFTLELAQAVASDGEFDGWTVLDALGGLVDKSLVQVIGFDQHATPRYVLLETTRQYALEQLSAAGEVQALCQRCVRVFAKWAEEVRESYRTLPHHQWLMHCQPEWENLVGALEWARGAGTVDEFVPLFIAATLIAPEGGDRVTLRRYVDTACVFAEHAAPALASQLLRAVGACLALVSNRRALEAFRAAVERARTAGDRWLLYRALVALARLLASGSSLATSEEIEAVIKEARALEDPGWPSAIRAILQHAEAGALLERGDVVNARARYLEACALYGQAASDGGVQSTRIALMDLEARAGNNLDAIRLGESLLPALRATRGPVFFPFAILCGLYARQGDLPRARSVGGEALRIVRRQQVAGTVFAPIALLIAREGRPTDAARLLGYADASLRASQHKFEKLDECFRHEALILIDAAMTQPERQVLMAEGERLKDAEADAIALKTESRDATMSGERLSS